MADTPYFSKVSIFKEILLESEAESDLFLDTYLRRTIQVPDIPGKAMIFTGVRRAGKSTLMKQVQMELQAQQGRDPFRSLHVNFFDERLGGLEAKDLNACIEAYYEIHPEVSKQETLHLFLDEIELIPGWELFIERQLRNKRRKVFITGSSSRLLSTEIATAMRGRSLSFEIFPFSFQEILAWEGSERAASRIDEARLRARLKKYLHEGGFPEVISETPSIQKRILQEYYDVLLLRDLLERNRESNIVLVRSFLKLLFQSFSSTITLNKCYERLKSLGIKTDKAKLSEILKWVEDCYLLFPITLFTESFSKQNVNPRKIYAIDNGMIKALTTQTSENSGRLLENAVFLHLRSTGKNIHYYKTKSGYEIDFVTDGQKIYQVAESIAHPDTYKREIRALEEAMGELGTQNSYLLTSEVIDIESSREIHTPTGTIHLLTAIDWFSQGRRPLSE